MNVERNRWWWGQISDAWRTRLWPFPVLGVLAAAGLGVSMPRLDARIIDDLPVSVTTYLFTGGPEAARMVLSVIAGSLITVTSLTFSLTVVTLQLAGGQYSPRVLRTFTRDRFVHASLALLLGTFTYSVTVLRTIRASADGRAGFVPQLSMTLAYLLTLVSVVTLVLFLAHLARQIRVESMLRAVHAETTATMRRVLDEQGNPDSGPVPAIPATGVVPLCSRSSGFLTSVDEQALLDAAVDAGAVVLVDRLPGDSVVAGTPVAVAWALDARTGLDGTGLATLEERVAGAIHTGFERIGTQDIAFGLRQLVDVAVRALSPGINDPTTAVHALSHAAALLCAAAGHDLETHLLRDDAGRVRVVLRRPDLPMLLDLVVTQPRRYGASEPQVMARLLMLLREVAWCSRRPSHHRAVAKQLARLRVSMDRCDYDPAEQAHLDGLAHSAQEALSGHWPPSRTPLTDQEQAAGIVTHPMFRRRWRQLRRHPAGP